MSTRLVLAGIDKQVFSIWKGNPGRFDHFWLSLVRIGIGFLPLFSLFLDPLTIRMKPGTLIIAVLFLLWGICAPFWRRFWPQQESADRMTAFIDLVFSAGMVVFFPVSSLNWVPLAFLLPIMELSSFYGIAGAVFVIITFAWVTILSGLVTASLIHLPSWWTTSVLWGALLVFTAVLQNLRLRCMHYTTPWRRLRRQRVGVAVAEKQVLEVLAPIAPAPKPSTLLIPQIVTALEQPFRSMGVHTEEHRREIEEAVNTLYCGDVDQQALTLCLHRLLQAARENWVGLAAFSPREQEILELLLQNITYKEMSSRLHVSPSTIKTHIYHIFQKLEVSNRDEAVLLVQQRGWFPSLQPAAL